MSGRTTDLYGALRARILNFDPGGPDGPLSGNAFLGPRLFTLEAPDNATYPFAIARLLSRNTGGGDDARLRERADYEIMVYHRPRTGLVLAERIADIMEEALLHYSTDALGLLSVRRLVSRGTLPAYQSAENREVVRVRLLWDITWWPQYRTQLANASGAPAPI
jgi:hypothetical protein